MKSFKNRLLFNIFYFLLWVGYFVFARLFFLLFYFDKTQELGLVTILKTFMYGARLDFSFASYLSCIPFLLIIFSVFVNPKKIGVFIKWYNSSNVLYKKMIKRMVRGSNLILVEGVPYLEFMSSDFNKKSYYFPNFVPSKEIPLKVEKKLQSKEIKILFVANNNSPNVCKAGFFPFCISYTT